MTLHSKRIEFKDFTSLRVGGYGNAYFASLSEQIVQIVKSQTISYVMGYGANSLVSDSGLDGQGLICRGGDIVRDDNLIIADAGVWWDDFVDFAINNELWGAELTFGIPGSVGAAIVGNIAAYGQASSDRLEWIEVIDLASKKVIRLDKADIEFSYRFSSLQNDQNLIVTKAAFRMSDKPTGEVSYDAILVAAAENDINLDNLANRKTATLIARQRAGSLWNFNNPNDYEATAGSFFKNPIVDNEKAAHIMSFDESGRSLELLKKMNLSHSGQGSRVSAAHVLLAAGFRRGQKFGNVCLNEKNLLKLQNSGGATAAEVFNTAEFIKRTAFEKLGVQLETEVKIIGNFSN